MDKLKLQLAPVAKHWFWIATGLVLLGSVGVWWIASGDLINQFQANKSKIEADANSVNTVSSKLDEHPNPKTHAEMEKLISASEQAVLDAWTTVYESQQDILVWPVEELTEDFVKEFRDLTPIELKVPFPTPEADEKETSLLNQYRYYIGNVLPGIAEIAKSKWTASFDKSGGGMGAMGGSALMGSGSESYGGYGSGQPGVTGVDEGPLVRWDTASQEKLLDDLFPWRASGAPPKTLNVLYSQENLWILRQLMQIIADVNGDVAQRFQAKIHNINRIAIGSSVSTTAGVLTKPAMGAMGGMGDGSMMSGGSYEDMGSSMDMGSSGMSDMRGMGGMEGMAGMGAGVEVDPGDNRYVDVAGKPLLASQLRSALSSNSPDDAKIAVAKRIPIMMSLKMDQRAVPDLIAKCGSAQLMVEVRQVRILPTGASSNMMAGGDMGSGSGGGGYGGMAMMESSGMGAGSGMAMGGGTPGNEQFPLDLDVEIYGIIYIYNPPLAEKLGVEQVTEDTVIDGTAMRDGSKVETAPAAAPTPETLPPPSDAVPADGSPVNVDAVPAAPPAQPIDPAAQPVDPAAQPVGPAAQPVDPAAQPVDPAVQPVDPAAQPVAPVVPVNAGVFWQQEPLFDLRHRTIQVV